MRMLHSKVIGGSLLVAGTTIGAGMLALPIVTGLAGFVPTMILFLVYWLYMTFTAFLMLEINLWLGDNVNLISMARQTLGKGGEIVAWITYLFLLYLLTAAYLAGGAPIVIDCIFAVTGIKLPELSGALPLLIIFGFFVYEGTRYVDALNRFLMVGLAFAYLSMAILITPHVEQSFLSHIDWKHSFVAISLVATSFGFHIIIPTLTTYMHHNVTQLRQAIIIGSIAPLVVYVIWEAMTLGVIPLDGKNGIIEGYLKGISGVKLLSSALGNSDIQLIAEIFSFFAIVTSFLGVTLSLKDFIADGLKIKRTYAGNFFILTLTFLPPSLFILSYPRAFVAALEFAGAFGVVILLGLLPPLMVWSLRYCKRIQSPFTVPGGKPALLAAIFLSLAIIMIEVANKMGLLEKTI